MASRENGKSRLISLLQIFHDETDEEAGITMSRIIELLAEEGLSVERKAVGRDIKALQDAGYDIRKLARQPVEYALVTRDFTHAEQLLLVDAVQSSRFVTERQAKVLVRSIEKLGPKRRREGLERRLHVSGRVKSENESVFSNLDVIQDAINAKRKISFRYVKYDCAKKPRIQHGGEPYSETPVQLVYAEGFYYLVVFNEKHGDFANYRVDRMIGIEVSEERAVRNARIAAFDAREYTERVFGMFSGEAANATLLVHESLMGALIDRFGRDVDVACAEEGWARARVRVVRTGLFFGWVAQYGGKVLIEAPAALRGEFVGYLRELAKAHEGDASRLAPVPPAACGAPAALVAGGGRASSASREADESGC